MTRIKGTIALLVDNTGGIVVMADTGDGSEAEKMCYECWDDTSAASGRQPVVYRIPFDVPRPEAVNLPPIVVDDPTTVASDQQPPRISHTPDGGFGGFGGDESIEDDKVHVETDDNVDLTASVGPQHLPDPTVDSLLEVIAREPSTLSSLQSVAQTTSAVEDIDFIGDESLLHFLENDDRFTMFGSFWFMSGRQPLPLNPKQGEKRLESWRRMIATFLDRFGRPATQAEIIRWTSIPTSQIRLLRDTEPFATDKYYRFVLSEWDYEPSEPPTPSVAAEPTDDDDDYQRPSAAAVVVERPSASNPATSLDGDRAVDASDVHGVTIPFIQRTVRDCLRQFGGQVTIQHVCDQLDIGAACVSEAVSQMNDARRESQIIFSAEPPANPISPTS